jgi:peptide/nickel transport system substrate-binding protein
MKAAWRWGALAAVLLLVFGVTSGLAQGQIKNPDTFIYDNIGQPDTLDPGWAFDTASYVVIEQLYEPLITYDGGATNKFKGVLAESWSISADGLTYTFKIRQGVKFHDGTPLTPEDVAYSFQRLFSIDRDGGSGFVVLVPILGVGSTRDEKGNLREKVTIRGKEVPLEEAICNAVQVKGDSVVFNLAQPFAPWLQILAGGQSHIISKQFTLAQAKAQNKVEFPGCPLTRDQLKQINNPENESKLALFNVANGTGPFKLVNWDQAQKVVTMARNDNYWWLRQAKQQ